MGIKRIGVLTAGGDAPGMNAVIRSVVRYCVYKKIEAVGILEGFTGLVDGNLISLNHRSVSNIINRGGTILRTSRCPDFSNEECQKRAVEVIKKNKIGGLILIGGDGTHRGALALSKKWHVPCICVPTTIDNDINGIDYTVGSDTAVNTALDAIDKIRDTAYSMERIFVVEVMGRESGFIALQVAVGGGAEEVLLPEKKFDLNSICDEIKKGSSCGKVTWIIVVAEGAARAADIADAITEKTGRETRVVVLGHIQRGGAPTARDRVMATRLGAAAVELLMKGESGKTIGMVSDEIKVVDLEYATRKKELKADDLYNLVKILI